MRGSLLLLAAAAALAVLRYSGAGLGPLGQYMGPSTPPSDTRDVVILLWVVGISVLTIFGINDWKDVNAIIEGR